MIIEPVPASALAEGDAIDLGAGRWLILPAKILRTGLRGQEPFVDHDGETLRAFVQHDETYLTVRCTTLS